MTDKNSFVQQLLSLLVLKDANSTFILKKTCERLQGWELNTFPFKLLILSYNKKSSRVSISETIATCLFFDHFLKPFLYFSSYTVNRTQPMKYKLYTKKAWDLSTPLTVWKCFCVQFLKGSWNLDCHWKLMALLKNRPKNFFKS